MRRNVLIKKNKILAFVLAAAIVFTSAPMQSVYAEEANATVTEDASQKETSDGEDQKEATDDESQKETTDGESQKDATDGESQKDATDGESQKDATDGESQKEVTDGEGQKEVTDGEGQKEVTDNEVMAIAEGDGGEDISSGKYLFKYNADEDSEKPSWLSGVTRVDKQMGKAGALQFNSSSAVNLPDLGGIDSGVVIWEMETLPAKQSIQRAVFKNSKGEELFQLGSRNKSDDSGEFNWVSGSDGSTKITGINGSWPQNTWSHYRVEIYFDNTENEDGSKVLKYKIYSSHYSEKNGYDADYSSEGWMPTVTKDQSTLINKDSSKYANGTITTAIDGSVEHPFDLKSITLYDSNKRWMGNFSLSHVTNIELTTEPGTQKAGMTFNPGDAAVTLTYSTGEEEVVKLADLTLGTDYTVSGLSEEITTSNEIIITYLGKALPVTVDVEDGGPVTLQSIEIETEPSQKYVELGGTLDTGDMVVKGTFSNGNKEVLSSDAYTVSLDTTSTGKKTVTVTYKDSGDVDPAEFDVIVTIASTTKDVKDIFSYNGEVASVDDLGFTIPDGVTIDLNTNGVSGNTTQKLYITGGSATKEWGYDLTTGVVKITTEMKKGNDAAFYRVLDEEGNPLIFFGQFGNTNLYDSTSEISQNGTSGTPYVTVVSGGGDNWIRFETEIDLDASNKLGILQFITKVYSVTTYPTDGAWGEPSAIITAETYNDKADFKTTNGCATAGLKSFSVSAVELSGRYSGRNAYYDNVYIGATDAVTLDSVEVTTQPTSTEYPIGATTLDLTGLVLTETYSDGTTKVLDTVEKIEAAYEISDFSAAAAGSQTITLTSKNDPEVSTTITVTVTNATIVSIRVETEPMKKEYFVGDEELDPAGLVVKATYSDDTTKEVTLTAADYIVGELKAETAGTEAITVTSVAKNDKGEVVTTTFDVTIKNPTVTGIEVTQKPSKLSYNINEATSLDTTGMVVTAIYDNGSKKEIPVGYTVGGFDASTETDSQTITVTYMGQTATFTISIVDPSKFKPVEYAFDFNIEGSKTGDGWIGISLNKSKGTTYSIADYGYSAAKSYGFDTTVTALEGRDENGKVVTNGDYVSIPVDVYRDYVLFQNAKGSFNVDLPNGTYNVQIIVATVEKNTTEIQIEGNDNYVGKAVFSEKVTSGAVMQVVDIPNVVIADGQMNILPLSDTIARTNAIIISNISAPTNLEGKLNASDVSVSLNWNASLGCVKYNVYRRAEDGTIEYLGAAEGTTYSDTEVEVLQTYTYYVRGVSQKGLETFASNEVSVEIKDENAKKPEKPVNVKAEPEEDKTTITWDAVNGAAYYEVYWSDRDRTSFEGTRYETSGLESYELLGTSTSATYVLELPTHIERYFKVVAVNSAGQSKPSDPAKADIVKVFNAQTEELDRGLVAIKTDYGVYLGWRLAKDEYEKGAAYKLYRDGECIRTFTVSDNTSYLDTEGTVTSKYTVSVVIDGTEGEQCKEVSVWENPYMEVKLNQPEPYYDDKLTKEHIKSTYAASTVDARVDLSTGDYVYTPNDTYIGDVDGDGEYELIVKWDGMSRDNSQGGYTSPVIIDCYKLDGTQLWRIDLGINIRAGAHYTQPVVADFDGDGKAEIMIRTADGTTDAAGTVIGDATADYRNTGSGSSQGQVISGPDFLTLFDGKTGTILDTIDYIPQRVKASNWGDSYGGRSERFLSGAAYLDGEHISAVFARGYYTRAVVAAFTVDENKKIVNQWTIDSSTSGNSSLYGQGAHSFTVADVDSDGCQEIIYGAATIDHDGTLLYSLADTAERFSGHGDALRVTDMNLKNPGLEAAMCKEDKPGAAMWDAETGELLFGVTAAEDVGRAASGDIDPYHEGGEFWFNGSNAGLHAADGTKLANRPSSVNHMVWFDGTMGRNFLDGSYSNGISSGYIAKWEVNAETGIGKQIDVIRDEGVETNNTTKANPCFQADIFGDWREEVGFRTDDNQKIRIYTSWEEMDYRLYTLMHDPTYRAQMACNGSAYNQSPDAGFYIGYDTALMQVPGGASYLALNGALERANDLDSADYTEESYADLVTAVEAVVTGLPRSSQADVDAMAKAVEDALAALVVLKPADYTAVDAALEKVKELEANADIYKNYDAVEDACEAVKRGYPQSKQDKVDAMAQAIEDAIAALKVKGADYTAVDEALEKVKGLIAEDYENFGAVEAAIAAVEQDLPKSEQDKVDAMAAAIEKAIEELVEIPADYTAVDAAIKKAGQLNPDDYVNYADVEANINAAIEAVKRGLLKSRQETVNAMAQAIEDAIAALEEKPDTPAPGATPTPEPDATPEPGATETPEPDATPEPGATATPEPDATPEPSTEPSPAPSTEPTPAPGAEATPNPAPDTEEPDEEEPDTEEPDEEETFAPFDISFNVEPTIPEKVLTEAVKKITGCDTVQALMDYMKQDVVAKAQSASKGIVWENTEVREVAVNVSTDGGKTWQPVTKETFPSNGIKIVLKYPEGTNKDEYDFVVSHLITIDRDDLNLKAGTIIYEDYVKTDEGLELNIMSASPFAIGWSKIVETSEDEPGKATPAKTGDNMYSILWMCAVVLVGALSMMAFIVVKRRRNR